MESILDIIVNGNVLSANEKRTPEANIIPQFPKKKRIKET